MTYKLSEKEIEAVLRLDAKKKLEHFAKRVADWESAWMLEGGKGFKTMGGGGEEYLPI